MCKGDHYWRPVSLADYRPISQSALSWAVIGLVEEEGWRFCALAKFKSKKRRRQRWWQPKRRKTESQTCCLFKLSITSLVLIIRKIYKALKKIYFMYITCFSDCLFYWLNLSPLNVASRFFFHHLFNTWKQKNKNKRSPFCLRQNSHTFFFSTSGHRWKKLTWKKVLANLYLTRKHFLFFIICITDEWNWRFFTKMIPACCCFLKYQQDRKQQRTHMWN